MSLPKEPRQKMINIMYLVLTALLAINISAEILNAFKTINNSLEKTNGQVTASSNQILKSLTEKMTDPKTAEKAGEWKPKADAVMGHATTAFTFIENLKKELIAASTTGGTMKDDEQNATTRILVKEGKGKELYRILDEYKKKVLAVDPKIATEFTNGFQVDLAMPKDLTSKKKSWEEAYFYMSPTIGALSILSKFQNDIRTSENKLVTFCHEQVGKVDIVFDSYAAIIGQTSNYVMPGQTFSVTAGVGAYSKAAQPQITINGGAVALGTEGFASKEITAGGPGTYSVPVRISYFNQTTGKQEVKEAKVEYTVGSPSGASVALDEMNVLYIGWQNKITVASSGGGDDKVQVSISGGGGSLNKTGAGRYIASVTTPTNDCKINVTVDGKTSSFPFRVRTIPDPVATVGGVASNENMTAGQFKAQTGVGAYIKDFPLDIKYSVVSFTLTADNADGDIDEAPCQGNTWSPKALGMIRGLSAGRMVTIDQIKAQGPDGRVRKVPGLTYYIK
jgi:gliding motility-associated protein GldM